ncbi:hypothetical protein [Variovorax paradoxus]|uniref:hypothetical protein n=1 Tax=Variovorax paradoxus TaxID=34073 RepID=UPI0012D4498F|nr:hypothetical protein [Variovorax paradoxus]
MNQSIHVESLAIFGSTSRGDADQISDRDVLLAGMGQISLVERELIGRGYSPSVYSWQQLEDLSRDGSLFLQHLRQESKILLDRNGRLWDLLEKFRPLNNYSHRIVKNVELFEMTNGTPQCDALIGWAFDVLAVGFRNHAILQLANAGRYVFSYPALVAIISKAHNLSANESQLLIDLRQRKREYRERCSANNGTHEVLKRTQAVIERITGADCSSRRFSIEDFVAHQVGFVSTNPHWYYPLRRLEGAFRAMGFTPELASSKVLAEMESVFSKPSPYGDAGMSSIEWVRTNVEAISLAWFKEARL